MAISPTVTRSPAIVTTPAKPKGLVVRNLVKDEDTVSPAPGGGSHLAEQLNEGVRRRYVKGIMNFQSMKFLRVALDR
jgi:hypothetical protein